jgi:hypothetical protein
LIVMSTRECSRAGTVNRFRVQDVPRSVKKRKEVPVGKVRPTVRIEIREFDQSDLDSEEEHAWKTS